MPRKQEETSTFAVELWTETGKDAEGNPTAENHQKMPAASKSMADAIAKAWIGDAKGNRARLHVVTESTTDY